MKSPKHAGKAAKKPNFPIIEGETHEAVIVKCPWAYRKIKDHVSTVGERVRVTASSVVNIEWEDGARSSVNRSCLRVLTAGRPPKKSKWEKLSEDAKVEAIAKVIQHELFPQASGEVDWDYRNEARAILTLISP